MTKKLEGKTVAILAADGFEQSELTSPKEALEQAGAAVHVVAPHDGSIRGFKHMEKGDEVGVDRTVDDASPDDYSALVIPGGVFNPDQLRTNQSALRFVRNFFEAGKPVGSICHGPQVLISAGLVGGRRMTAVESVRKDLGNAGAEVVNEEVVVDSGLVTSRTPEDLAAFNTRLIEEIAEGRHAAQATG